MGARLAAAKTYKLRNACASVSVYGLCAVNNSLETYTSNILLKSLSLYFIRKKINYDFSAMVKKLFFSFCRYREFASMPEIKEHDEQEADTKNI